MTNATYWWIAINGNSCAKSMIAHPPPPRLTVIPRPWQLIGFKTQAEQLAAQKICIEAPIAEVSKFMDTLGRRIDKGELVGFEFEPEPPTTGQTHWLVDGQAPDVDHASDADHGILDGGTRANRIKKYFQGGGE